MTSTLRARQALARRERAAIRMMRAVDEADRASRRGDARLDEYLAQAERAMDTYAAIVREA